MKKTINVNLSGVVFTLDDDAYEILKKYLDEIKAYFSRGNGDEEVVADIESSIADKFTEKIKGAKQVITKSDVEQLIKVMGVVEEIVDEPSPTIATDGKPKPEKESEKEEHHLGKKLYRNTDNAVIAGVCSGLGAFFGIDPIIFRLIFALSIFAGGVGILIYIILWVVMPEAKTSTQKLEMKGDTVTIKKLEAVAKDQADKIKSMDKSGLKRAFALPIKFFEELFRVSGRFLGKFGMVIGVIIGIILVVAAVLAMTAVGFATATIVFNLDSPFFNSEIPFSEIFNTTLFPIGMTALFFVVFIPLLFILLLGATLASRKNAFNAATNSVLIGIWMIAVIVVGVVAVEQAPGIQARIDAFELAQQGETETREFSFEGFNMIKVRQAHEAYITPGEDFSIIATGPEEEIGRLELRMVDSELIIDNESGYYCWFCRNQGVRFDITMPALVALEGSGATKLEAADFSGQDFDLDLSGASQGKFELAYDMFDILVSGASKLDLSLSTSTLVDLDVSGASRAKITGQAERLETEASGASQISTRDLEVSEATADASGASDIELRVSETLEAEASGGSRIRYQGKPQVTENTSGGGKVESF